MKINKKIGFCLLLSVFCFLSFAFCLLPANASSVFNPNFIISDEEMQDADTMSKYDIQKFLDVKASYLRTYKTTDIDGRTKTASEIIHNAAQTYQINPKYVLVTLQKEQSLITAQNPTQKQLDWAAGYAVCDSCSMDDPNIQKYKGFAKQVDNTAGIIRWYYENTDHPVVKQVNTPIKIDSQTITPQSWATAFLYTYTPHLHGNENFNTIWNDWFSQTFPNGTILKAVGKDDYWLIQDGKRKKFKNLTALLTRTTPQMAVVVPEEQLASFSIGAEIGLPNYSILKQGTKYYLIDNYTIRPFESYGIVKKLGYNPQEIIEVSTGDIEGYEMGTAITAQNTSPSGKVVYIKEIGQYYLLKDDVLRPFISKTVVEASYSDLPLEKHTKSILSDYTIDRTPVNFKNGTLLRAEGSIFVMEDGKRRRISDDKTFLALGYKKSNIVEANALTALLIPRGEPVYLPSALEGNNIHLLNADQKIEDLFDTSLPTYLVADYDTDLILAGKNIDEQRPIASLTKILTALGAMELNFQQNRFTVYDSKKHGAYGNYLKLVDGEKIRNIDLFNIMLTASINNTARMVADSTGYSEKSFVEKINELLADWRLEKTKMEEPTGLSEKNVSTAREVLAFFTKALADDVIKQGMSYSEYEFNELYDKNNFKKHEFTSSNKLAIPGYANQNYKVLASKTGYIDESGAHLAMLIESISDNKKYIVITMGDKNWTNRFDIPHQLATWTANKEYLDLNLAAN